ncbi:MAG TPA: M12 family metallo-peptidase [Candidatus Limnocylindrales bacterium]|nr:M12 family metallo-peptidase [Candidatus Limnocylindrales bacterium]
MNKRKYASFLAAIALTTARAVDAQPVSATPRTYSQTSLHVLRAKLVSQSKALRAARGDAVDRRVDPRLEEILGPTSMLNARVRVEGRDMRLRLAEYEPVLDDGAVLEQLPDGSWQSQPVVRNGTRFYVGRETSDRSSFVTLYRTESDGWGGRIELQGGTYMLEPSGWSDPSEHRELVEGEDEAPSYVFREDDTEEFLRPAGCGDLAADEDAPSAADDTPRHVVLNGQIVKYDVRYVAASDYWLARGQDDNVIGDEIFAMHYATSNAMQQQVSSYGVALSHGWAVLHQNLPSPPFTNPTETDGGLLLSSVIACKASSSCLGGQFYGSDRIATLLVSRTGLHKSPPESGRIAGIARTGGLCSANSAAVIETTGSAYARFARLAHELGHVFGACHDGPVPGPGCSAPTGCPDAKTLMSPVVGDSTVPQYSTCAVNLMNSRVNATAACRTPIYCGDVNADAKISPVPCPDGGPQPVNPTDALIALKLAVGQANPVSYSHLADVFPPFGALNSSDANALLDYSVCSPIDYPPACGN